MTWFDDLGAGTYQTKTTTVGAGIPAVFYDKRFMELLTEELVLMRFAQLRPLPEGNGTTVEFTRPRPLSPSTTALSEGQNPNATNLYFQKIRATIAEYGDWGQITSLARAAHMNQDVLGAVETFSAQAAESMNLWLLKEVCANGCFPLTADQSATSTFNGTFTTVTSTSVLVDTALGSNTNYGDENDDLNQSICSITSGPAKGESRTVTDYTTAAGTMTFTRAFDMTPEVGDTYTVTTPDEITTGDDLSYGNLKAARTLLMKQHARKFGNGFFACVIGPDQAKNLADDSDWKNLQIYKEKTKGLSNLMFSPFAGFAIYETTVPFAFPLTASRGTAGAAGGPGNNGGNYAASGEIQTALCFGKDSFGATTFSKQSGKLAKPPVRVKYPNQFDKADMLDRWTGVGWVLPAAFKSLYSLHCVGIWTSGT